MSTAEGTGPESPHRLPGVLMPAAGHFVYIPAILLLGLVVGWILGSRAAADAYAADLRRREERAARRKAREA